MKNAGTGHHILCITAPGSKMWDFDYNALHQRTQVTYPNGMKAVYGYDTANRLTKIKYNDGAGSPTVLDGWVYTLGADGNIMKMKSLLSDQRWDYYYDGNDRLLDGVRRNASGVAQFREQYVYDAGDNMLTKSTYLYDQAKTVNDDFTDGDYTAGPAWTLVAGSWAVDTSGDAYLKNTGTTSDQLRINNTVDNVELITSYRLQTMPSTTESLDFTMRYNSAAHATSDRVHVRFHTDRMELLERYNNVWSIADFPAAASALNTWYKVHIRCVGTRLEVWREDAAGAMQLAGALDGIQTTGTSRVMLSAAGAMTAHADKMTYLFHKSAADSKTDDFADGNYTASPTWVAEAGAWGVTSGVLNATQTTGSNNLALANTSPDNQIKLSIKKGQAGGELRVYTREVSGTQKTFLYISDSSVAIKEQNPTTSTLVSKTLTTTTGTWYDYHIITDGKHMEVWRGPQGGTTELILETDACTVPASTRFTFNSWTCTAGYDNIEFITNDPATQTMAYNGANELTTSVTGAITTTYTYDANGRTISKANGTHSARYIWFAGDKLKQYESDFPGEADVAFNYDGFGKRRVKLVNISAPTDADYTWYRWDAGWNMVGEYAAGADAGTTWDVGALTRHYSVQPGSQRGTVVSHTEGEPNSSAYSYYFHEHLGTPQVIRDGSKVLTGRQQTSAYGMPMVYAGVGGDVVFTGHKWDKELGGLYAPYRYYFPQNGRWTTQDANGTFTNSSLPPTSSISPFGLSLIAKKDDTTIDPCTRSGKYCGQCCDKKSADCVLKNPRNAAKCEQQRRCCEIKCLALGDDASGPDGANAWTQCGNKPKPQCYLE